MLIDRILVVCTGNICRSPIGEGLLRTRLIDAGMSKIKVASAGTAALIGHAADPLAIITAEAHGIDIRSHRARACTPELIVASQLILVMEQQQRRSIEKLHTAAKGRVFMYSRFTDDAEIADPYGGSEEFFSQIYDILDKSTQAWVKVLAKH